ncbi:hypothetical protein PHAVU_008G207600, partial [Phaseolus vulgaris]
FIIQSAFNSNEDRYKEIFAITVWYNQAKEHFECHDVIDLILLNDIDDSNKWSVREMGGDGKDAEDDLIFNDDTSTWKESANAAGAGKPLTYPRQQTRLKRAATFKLASTRVKGKEEDEDIYNSSSSNENDNKTGLNL